MNIQQINAKLAQIAAIKGITVENQAQMLESFADALEIPTLVYQQQYIERFNLSKRYTQKLMAA